MPADRLVGGAQLEDSWSMNNLLKNFRFWMRVLLQNPEFTAIAVPAFRQPVPPTQLPWPTGHKLDPMIALRAE